MSSSWCSNISPLVTFLLWVLAFSSICSVYSLDSGNSHATNRAFKPEEELQKLKIIRERLKKINKPAVKTIQSPDGDLIDCVLSHHQPAFDHPRVRGQKPLEPPERPKGHNPKGMEKENFQLWSMSGESCPEETIPIRRTTEQDILRASSYRRYGRKLRRHVRRDSRSNGHEHAVGFVSGDKYYGAKASISVWAPKVANLNEFSLSQIWVISGQFGDDLNTIEAGWQVSPEMYGDFHPRFFTYWTSDSYQATGCYNLLCSGFVQTSNRIAIGAAISPTSSYKGGQFDISLLIWKHNYRLAPHASMSPLESYVAPNMPEIPVYFSTFQDSLLFQVKDPKHGNWWLQFGSGLLVGYWPSYLFTRLRDSATMVQFGGEIVNTSPSGSHTPTQMGSGHFGREGFRRASYFRNLQVVDWDNILIPLSNLRVLADHPNCYDIKGGRNRVWGNYFYYGGPGRNVKCP